MKCADLEILLCDYIDATLSEAEIATVELHLRACPACQEIVADGRAAIAFMQRAADVEPPAALVNRILFEARSGHNAPVRPAGGRNWIAKLFEPLLQPKFAMGMAMTILSFSMLGRFAGIPVRDLKASDLEPARLWATLEDKAWRTWERAKKYYESLRLVYEIQQTLKDWNETGERREPPEAGAESGPPAGAATGGVEGATPPPSAGAAKKTGPDGRASP
jgi:hypothetical protein